MVTRGERPSHHGDTWRGVTQAPLQFKRNPRYESGARKPAAGPEQPKVPTTDTIIHCTPQKILFTEYEAGGVYEITLSLRNVSHLSRRLRVLPPSTRFFSISLIAYPSEEGHLAPGMKAEVRAHLKKVTCV